MIFEAKGLNELITDLTNQPRKVQRGVVPVVTKGAVDITRDARRLSSGLRHAPAYPFSISYETKWTGASYGAEIGPDKDKPQGALGNLLEYGSANNAPITHLGPALDLEGPKFIRAIAELGDL